jgi:putative two-component system response regulator
MNARALDPNGVEMALRLRYACEAHEESIAPHLDRVSDYACGIARMLDLPEEQIEFLRHAVPLHDVGKIGLSTELLRKPTTLTDAEMEIIRSHTLIGHRILAGSRSPVMQCAARIALSHHEAWNGHGYPHALAGSDIPIDARITAIADVYDALLSQRAYKPAWEHDAVILEMQRLRAVKFDPDLLDLFIENLAAVKVA